MANYVSTEGRFTDETPLVLRVIVLQKFKGVKLFVRTIWPATPHVFESRSGITCPDRRSRLNWFHGLAPVTRRFSYFFFCLRTYVATSTRNIERPQCSQICVEPSTTNCRVPHFLLQTAKAMGNSRGNSIFPGSRYCARGYAFALNFFVDATVSLFAQR